MSDTVEVKSFPSNRVEALALEYVKVNITPDTPPEDLARLYLDAYARIRDSFKADRENS